MTDITWADKLTSDQFTAADANEIKQAVNSKANVANAALTGTPTAPTAPTPTNTTQIASTAFVQAVVTALINAAPGALDTLDELAAALGDDANFAATMTTALAGKQPLDADLTAIAGLTSAADRVPYFTGSGTAALATFTTAGRALVDDASAAAQRTTLGLVIGTNVQAYDANLPAWPSTVSATEVGYLDGVTSSIQTQLDGKQASGSYATAAQGATAEAALPKADGVYVFDAGANNNAVRPTGYALVYWTNVTAEPTNAVAGDLWLEAV